ncbi:protein FAM227B [Antechinus flavipes]|uniref:protein FAM227B n=1 Tax=Antechinus flavipes TaxID=38775 RepID=UPI002235CDCD|nr:protein FAM227B [Antechinus flavipes]
MEEPPITIEDFLKAQNIDEWPKSTHFRYDAYTSSLAVKSLRDACSLDSIHKYLCDNVTTKHKALLEMEFRMKDLFDDFHAHASLFLHYMENTALEAHTRKLEKLRKMIEKKRKKTVFWYPYDITKKKTVQNFTFLGFRVNMPSKLPRHLTASEIYLYVLKTQKLDAKSFKIWSSLLLTDSSLTLLQDAFWWWFLYKYKHNQHDEDLLFDRISESFVSVIMKAPNYRKDTFYKLYPNCVAQAIYTIFQEAFPDSSHLFNDAFKDELVMTIFQWMTGIKPPKGIWNQWNLGTLEEITIHGNIKRLEQIHKESSIETEATIKHLEFDLDRLIHEAQNSLLPVSELAPSIPRKSHVLGHGTEFCHVLFRIGGQSPLVAYYLKMHNIAIIPIVPYSYKIHMTQVFRWPTDLMPTYRDAIAESKKILARNKAAYKVKFKTIREEIKSLKNKQLELNKNFLRLKNKARRKPEKAMSDCLKYLEKLRQEQRPENYELTRSPSSVAAATVATIPALAYLPSCRVIHYPEDEKLKLQHEKEPVNP